MSESGSSAKAVVLLSGGLDSAVVLAHGRAQGYACYALTADYGQRHAVEIERARRLASVLGAQEHKVVKVDLRAFGGSALTDNIAVPLARRDLSGSQVPVTYVPARNTVLLALGLAWAEVLRAERIGIGVNAVDYSGYPDCRPEYIQAFERMAHLATRAGTQTDWAPHIWAPLLTLSKAEIIALGRRYQLDFALTLSCYQPGPQGEPCGQCEACTLRRKGFLAAGEQDPTAAGLSSTA